ARAPRRAGGAAVHPRRAPRNVPQAPVDHAPVRGLRVGQGVQRALPLPAGQREHGPVDGLRPPHPARPGLRRPAVPGRGRPHRRGDRHGRRHADRLRRHPARRGLDVDDHQRARQRPAGALRPRRRGAGRPERAAPRHGAERHPQGVHRPRELHLPARALHAAHGGPVRLLQAAHPQVVHGVHLGLPLPREGLLGGAGGGVHAGQRHRVRAGGGRRRPGRGRLRPAPGLLLQRPQQRLPGGRQVPRGPEDLGRDDARPVRRQGPQDAADPLPHADRRRDAHRPAAGQQHRARGAAGVRRGERRHAVPAHQRLRRGAGPAHRARRQDRAADPADRRPRVRRDRHRRPVRRLVLRRGAHRRDRAPRPRADRQDRRHGRLGRGDRVHQGRDRGVGLGLPGALRERPGHRRRRQQVRRGRHRGRGDPARGPAVRARPGRAPQGVQGRPRPGARPAAPRRAQDGRRGLGQPAVSHPPGAQGPLLDGRGVRRDARGLRGLPARDL
ncbi:MAG: Methylmalonyl-CoA mutase, partial [uncultured Solirubrobacteraceae bacterium]